MEKSPYHIDVEPAGIYHLFSRGEGNELLFKSEENYHYFLKKLNEYSREVCSILAFSLLPNHFHLLIKVKSETELLEIMASKKKLHVDKTSKVSETFEVSKFILQQFSNFLNSYTKSFNKMYNRKGGLFMNRLRRAKVNKDIDLSNFIFYIHKNAVHHGFTNKIGDWKFDSYNIIRSEKPTSLDRKFVLEWFGSKKSFTDFHQQEIFIKTKIEEV